MKMIKLPWFMLPQISYNQAVGIDLYMSLITFLVHILQVLFLHALYLLKLAFIKVLGRHIVVTEKYLVVHIRRVELVLTYNSFHSQYIEVLYVESIRSLLKPLRVTNLRLVQSPLILITTPALHLEYPLLYLS